MARTPRIRHLNHRTLDKLRYQDTINNFVDERTSALTQYSTRQDVWDAIASTSSIVVANEVDIP